MVNDHINTNNASKLKALGETLGSLAFGVIVGAVITALTYVLELVLSWINPQMFDGMTIGMVNNGFSPGTLAFLMTAASLLAILSLYFDFPKRYVLELYNSILFGLSFLTGVLVFLAFMLLLQRSNDYMVLLPLAVLLGLQFALLFAARYASNVYNLERDERGMKAITFLVLLAIALVSIPVVHWETNRNTTDQAARSGKPEPGSSSNR